MSETVGKLVEEQEGAWRILKESKRIAVLGIKPESHAHLPAHYVPAFLQRSGWTIVPVPVYYPEVTEILGERVYRRLADIPEPVDLVVVFRRPRDIPPHVPDLIARSPRAVWFQLGIRNDEAARDLAAAGMDVVQDRCTMVEVRRMGR
ncbi:MAG TPA: CoA-binding protein [Longimicrobiales bacterium]